MWLRAIGLILLALAIFVAPLAAEAQQATRMPRIGFLASSNERSVKSFLAAFKQALQALGYVEGRNVILEDRYAEGSEERLRDQAALIMSLLILAGAKPSWLPSSASPHDLTL